MIVWVAWSVVISVKWWVPNWRYWHGFPPSSTSQGIDFFYIWHLPLFFHLCQSEVYYDLRRSYVILGSALFYKVSPVIHYFPPNFCAPLSRLSSCAYIMIICFPVHFRSLSRATCLPAISILRTSEMSALTCDFSVSWHYVRIHSWVTS